MLLVLQSFREKIAKRSMSEELVEQLAAIALALNELTNNVSWLIDATRSPTDIPHSMALPPHSVD